MQSPRWQPRRRSRFNKKFSGVIAAITLTDSLTTRAIFSGEPIRLLGRKQQRRRPQSTSVRVSRNGFPLLLAIVGPLKNRMSTICVCCASTFASSRNASSSAIIPELSSPPPPTPRPTRAPPLLATYAPRFRAAEDTTPSAVTRRTQSALIALVTPALSGTNPAGNG